MKVIYVLPQSKAFELEVSGSDTLRSLQALVGGSIDGIKLHDLDGYVNDEGLLWGLPPNVSCETGALLVGPIVFTRTDEKGKTISVKDGDLEEVQAWLNSCERPGRFDYGY